MFHRFQILVITGLGIAAGCHSGEGNNQTASSAQSSPNVSSAAATDASGASAGSRSAQASESASMGTGGSAPSASTTVDSGGGSQAAPATQPTQTANDAKSTADKLFEQTQQYIKDNKLDDADADLKKLEAMSDQLPPSMQQQVASLRKQLDTARSALGGVKLPGQGGQ